MGILPWIVLGCGVVVFVVVTFAWRRPSQEGAQLNFWELTRDVGMALVVAAVVSLLFEIYQRSHESEEAIQRAFNASMGERLTHEVWQDVKAQVLDKHLLRRNVAARFKLTRAKDLPSNLRVMELELTYDLYNLDDKPAKFAVQHELDYQFSFPAVDLPRFTRVVREDESGSKEYQGKDLAAICSRGIVSIPAALKPKSLSHVRIRTHRLEVVQAPGSYNLYMNEFTKGLTLRLDDPPNDIGIDIKIRPGGKTQVLKQAVTDEWECPDLILPGQGIEIKFLEPDSARG